MPDFNELSRDERRPQKSRNQFRYIEGNPSFERILTAIGRIPAMEGVLHGSGDLNWEDTENRICAHLVGSMGKIPGFKEASRKLGRELESKTLIEGGQEHFLYPDEKTGTVLKFTFGNNFGAKLLSYPELPEIGRSSVLATTNIDPSYYLHRWVLLNSNFPPITRFESILPPHKGERIPRFVIRQKLLKGNNPSLVKIQQAFKTLGFTEIADHTYYRIKDNLLLGDAAPRNIRLINGVLHPFDAIAENPQGESQLLCGEKADKYK